MVRTTVHLLNLFLTRVYEEILENVNPDLSDSEFIEREDPIDAPTPAIGSDVGDAATPGGNIGGSSDDDESSDEGEGDIDEDLAAELDQALEEGDDEEEEDEDEDEESDEEDEDEDEDDETVQTRKLLNEEIRDLEAAVKKKEHEIASSVNPLIKVCSVHSTLCFIPFMFASLETI
jgi:transcription initiation factor TFIID subunit 7